MLAIIMAIFGGGLFYWLQKIFKKIGADGNSKAQNQRYAMQFITGIAFLAILVFLIPFMDKIMS